MRLLTAELRKWRTVRTTWVLTVIGWALVALTGAGAVFTEQAGGGVFTGTDEQVGQAVGQIGANAMIVLIVALLGMTTEFRHGTIGRTLQLTPSRSRVLATKLVAGVVYAVAFFLTSLLVVGAVLLIAAARNAVGLSVGGETAAALWQGPVGLALNAIFGVAVGALIRSQVVAITLALVWLFVVENLVTALRPGIGRWLPFQAINSLFIAGDALPAAPEGMVLPLEPAVALAAFLSYVALATLAAGILLRTRDV